MRLRSRSAACRRPRDIAKLNSARSEREQGSMFHDFMVGASLLFDNRSSLRIHKNVVTVAILTGDQIITVTVAFGLDNFVGGLPLQTNSSLKVLTHRRILCNQ